MRPKAGEKCLMCDGTGKVYDPHCTVPGCDTGFTEGQMACMYASPAKFLPCGHRFKYLTEHAICGACQGKGFIDK